MSSNRSCSSISFFSLQHYFNSHRDLLLAPIRHGSPLVSPRWLAALLRGRRRLQCLNPSLKVNSVAVVPDSGCRLRGVRTESPRDILLPSALVPAIVNERPDFPVGIGRSDVPSRHSLSRFWFFVYRAALDDPPYPWTVVRRSSSNDRLSIKANHIRRGQLVVEQERLCSQCPHTVSLFCSFFFFSFFFFCPLGPLSLLFFYTHPLSFLLLHTSYSSIPSIFLTRKDEGGVETRLVVGGGSPDASPIFSNR